MSYLDDIADAVRQELAPEDRPPVRGEGLFRLYALLVLVTGVETTLEDVHHAWSLWMTEVEADHPSLVPFGQLSPSTQSQDLPYQQAIVRVAGRRRRRQ